VIDGVRLGRFHPGFVYDLHASLATYLIGCGAADEMSSTSRVIIRPPEEFDLLERMTTGGVLIVPTD